MEGIVGNFSSLLDRLKDWPDKNIIDDLTRIAGLDINLAPQVSSTMISKLTSGSLNSSYKLPLFYVMDSIMKRIGGPFPLLFSKFLFETYSFLFGDLLEKDRGKLGFLLDTWLERQLMPADLVSKIKIQLSTSKAVSGLSINVVSFLRFPIMCSYVRCFPFSWVCRCLNFIRRFMLIIVALHLDLLVVDYQHKHRSNSNCRPRACFQLRQLELEMLVVAGCSTTLYRTRW